MALISSSLESSPRVGRYRPSAVVVTHNTTHSTTQLTSTTRFTLPIICRGVWLVRLDFVGFSWVRLSWGEVTLINPFLSEIYSQVIFLVLFLRSVWLILTRHMPTIGKPNLTKPLYSITMEGILYTHIYSTISLVK